jgi:hypothetical protein
MSMGTASNGLYGRSIGINLPGAATIPAVDARKNNGTIEWRIVEMVKEI